MKPLQIFLSARYSRRDELKRIRYDLNQHGYPVCSRWLDTDWTETERDAIYSSAAPPERREEYAMVNVEDVRSCDVFIAFTEEPRSSSRGGRHVETGIAIGLHKPIIVIGPQENIFYHLPKMCHILGGKYDLDILLASLRAIEVGINRNQGVVAYEPF